MIFDVRGTYDTISTIKEVVDTTKYNEVICLVDDFEYHRLLKELDKSEEKWGFNFTSERIILEIGEGEVQIWRSWDYIDKNPNDCNYIVMKNGIKKFIIQDRDLEFNEEEW